MIRDVWLTERKKIDTLHPMRKTSTDTSWSVNSPLTPFWDETSKLFTGLEAYCFACLQVDCVCLPGDDLSTCISFQDNLRDNISNLTFNDPDYDLNDPMREMTTFLNEDLYSQSAPAVDHFGPVQDLTLNSPIGPSTPFNTCDNIVHFDRRRAVTLDTFGNKRTFDAGREPRQRKKSSTSIISSSSSSTCINFPKLKPVLKSKAQTIEEYGEPTPQSLRFENDFYTPRFVRGTGKTKQGLCPHCKDTEVWLVLKNSSYGYHLRNLHGISTSGHYYPSPVETRKVWTCVSTDPPKGTTDQRSAVSVNLSAEGYCHLCDDWFELCKFKRRSASQFSNPQIAYDSMTKPDQNGYIHQVLQIEPCKLLAISDAHGNTVVPPGISVPPLEHLAEINNVALGKIPQPAWYTHMYNCHRKVLEGTE